MNRIDQKFTELKKKRKKAFIAFVTAGDPNLKTTEELVLSFERAGVDIVELGVPFSDPLADGLTIQASSQRALQRNVNLDKILKSVRNIRKKSQIPIALMTYYNPVFHYGEAKFVSVAKRAGVDGLIIPDLPPEEADTLIKAARVKDLSTIFFLSPTTTVLRIKKIVKVSTGFTYFVALTGVTGARRQLPPALFKQVRLAKRFSRKPICVGFGISTAAQVKSVAKAADGIIVGSAIVSEIEKNSGKKNLIQNVTKLVKKLTKGVSG